MGNTHIGCKWIRPKSHPRSRQNSKSIERRIYLGMVTHLVLQFCVVMAFSSSSSWAVFFNFFTRLFTAFSHHFSSWPFCSPLPAPLGPVVVFFHPSSLFTTGGVNGKMEDMFPGSESPEDPTHTQNYCLGPCTDEGPSIDQWVTGWLNTLNRDGCLRRKSHTKDIINSQTHLKNFTTVIQTPMVKCNK